MKKTIAIMGILLTLISGVVYVFASKSIKIDVDEDLIDYMKNNKDLSDSELTDLVNNYLLEQKNEDLKEQMMTQYKETGFHLSDVFSNGQVSEMDRIYNCVFP